MGRVVDLRRLLIRNLRIKGSDIIEESVRTRIITFEDGSSIKHKLDSDAEKAAKIIDLIIIMEDGSKLDRFVNDAVFLVGLKCR